MFPLLALLVMSFLFASCTGGAASGGSSFGSDPVSNQVFHTVNAYRHQKGKGSLERHSGLDRLARLHCEYLVAHRGQFSLHGKNVSHYGFQERVLAARRHYGMDSVSENVVAGQVSAANPAPELLEIWKRSKSHHINLLQSWRLTGVGSVKAGDGTIFCTQLFATKAIGHQQLRDRINNNY